MPYSAPQAESATTGIRKKAATGSKASDPAGPRGVAGRAWLHAAPKQSTRAEAARPATAARQSRTADTTPPLRGRKSPGIPEQAESPRAVQYRIMIAGSRN